MKLWHDQTGVEQFATLLSIQHMQSMGVDKVVIAKMIEDFAIPVEELMRKEIRH